MENKANGFRKIVPNVYRPIQSKHGTKHPQTFLVVLKFKKKMHQLNFLGILIIISIIIILIALWELKGFGFFPPCVSF